MFVNPKLIQVLKDEYNYNPKKELYEQNFVTDFKARDHYIKTFGYVVISNAIISILAKICKDKAVLDIASGCGWLAYKLEQAGINITAIDNHSTHKFEKIWKNDIKMDALDFDITSYDVIILSWPPYEDIFGHKILQKIRENQLLIYQGEGSGGCCANDYFYTYLDDHFIENERLSDELNQDHLQFFGLHDYWHVYNRSNNVIRLKYAKT